MADRGTIFLTGASGFIARHIVLRLLEEGYRVRGSVRSLDRGREVAEAIRPHLSDPSGLDERLSFAELDLLRDDGWDDALKGCDALIHTASPFPFERPANEDEVIRPAVEGTLRALKAAHAAGIGRVVLTSSVAAVINTELEAGRDTYDERDWSDLFRTARIALREVQDDGRTRRMGFCRRGGAGEIALTVINPGFVLGPPLGGAERDLVQGPCSGSCGRRIRWVPHVGFVLVDVRDVATMHVRALDRPETGRQADHRREPVLLVRGHGPRGEGRLSRQEDRHPHRAGHADPGSSACSTVPCGRSCPKSRSPGPDQLRPRQGTARHGVHRSRKEHQGDGRLRPGEGAGVGRGPSAAALFQGAAADLFSETRKCCAAWNIFL